MSTTIEVVCFKYKPLKNNEFPLRIRITKDRKTKYISLGVSVAPQYWDFDRNQPTLDCPDREYLEKLIANKLCECKGKVVELKSENREFTATTLKEQISKPVKAVTVGELFEQIIRELQDERRTGYATSVEQVYRSLLKFNKHLSAYFSDIDHLWLKRYELWLRRQGRAENTIGVRFRTLRMVFNQAIERGYAKMEQYPFKSYKVGKLHAETPKRAISVTVTNVLVWNVEQSRMNDFTVAYEVDQQIKEGEQTQAVTENYTVTAHVDKDGAMVITQNPTLAPAVQKSKYEPKVQEADVSVSSDTVKDATAFLETFFKLYPTATEKELAYYVKDGVLAPVSGDYVFSELVNPVFTKDGDNLKVSVSVKYLDNKSKMTQISQYELMLHKDDNWKIVE